MATRAFKPNSRTSISKAERREARKAKRRGDSNVYDMNVGVNQQPSVRKEGINTRPVQYKTGKQKTYHQMIQEYSLVFGIGPAGTGKTHIAADHAALMLIEKKISKIIVCRPAVESGRGLGFLPGEMADKWAPYFKPVRRILEKRLGVSHVENLIKLGSIEIAPLEFLRGDTFENAVVLLDEAQNTTCHEMLTFLTRLGQNCTAIVDGDLQQIDIKEPSGLADALQRLQGMPDFAVCEFDESEIIRHELVKEIIKRYRQK